VHKVQAHLQNCSKLSVCFPVPPVSLVIYIATRKANTEEFKTARTSIRPRISQIKYRRETGIIFVQCTGVYIFHYTPTPMPTQLPIQWVLGLFRGLRGRGVVLTTLPLLVPGCEGVGVSPSPLLCACYACHGVTFTFTLFRVENLVKGTALVCIKLSQSVVLLLPVLFRKRHILNTI
jgi:hypothetical protein